MKRGRAVQVTAIAAVAILAASVGARAGSGKPDATSTADAVTSTLGAGPVNQAFPQVAADGSSGFDAVWAGDTAVMTAHWSAATQSWSAAAPLSGRLSGQSIPQVAASGSGAAAAIWRVISALGPEAIQASYRPADGGAWQPAATLFFSRTQSVSSPQVGIDDRGDAFAVWGTDAGVVLAEHPAGATGWSRRVVVAKLGMVGFAVSPGGALALGLERHLSGGTSPNSPSRNLLYVKVKPPGHATWLRRWSLGQEDEYGLQGDGPPGTYLPGPRMAINASGTVFVTWQWLHRNTFYARVAILSAGRRWRPRVVTMPAPG